MWLLISRTPRPDAAYWPGRRLLALLDAVAWPTLWVGLLVRAPFRTGVVGTVAMALLVTIAARRSHKAIFRNERYRFTTWRYGLVLTWSAVVGAVMKMMT